MYGCGTWSLRADQQRRLNVLQRKMLRMVLNAKRRTIHYSSTAPSVDTTKSDDGSDDSNLEPWADFLKRTARWTEEQLQNAGLSQWLVLWKRRKWQWAGKLVEEGADKWSTRAALWQPLTQSSAPRGRRQARPRRRWDQDLVDHIKQILPETDKRLHELARDKDWWLAETDRFAST